MYALKNIGGVCLRKFIKLISENISTVNQYTKDQEEQVEYALRVFIFETLKIIGSIIIFSLIGYPIQAIVAIITMCAIKPYIGGYHEDTQLKCFIATLIIIAIITYLSLFINLNFMSKVILSIVVFFAIWHQAPIINPAMPLTRKDLINRNRILGLSIATIFILIALIFSGYIVVSNTILWTLIISTLLMFNKRSR